MSVEFGIRPVSEPRKSTDEEGEVIVVQVVRPLGYASGGLRVTEGLGMGSYAAGVHGLVGSMQVDWVGKVGSENMEVNSAYDKSPKVSYEENWSRLWSGPWSTESLGGPRAWSADKRLQEEASKGEKGPIQYKVAYPRRVCDTVSERKRSVLPLDLAFCCMHANVNGPFPLLFGQLCTPKATHLAFQDSGQVEHL
ncbi:hypothetical protein KP509_01G012700 [Ceratopteris richardii]|uniref:Uncharacterized protein n=1 Tax=Ceratopteris richardii TaxID=49495 RepID=A0A8T2VM37_CERRI|nr:hypothetical protein KP509_01G012700 [Ceratopteris richardii]